VGDLVHGIERVLGAELQLEGLCLGFELAKIRDGDRVGSVVLRSIGHAVLNALTADSVVQHGRCFAEAFGQDGFKDFGVGGKTL